MYWAMVVTYTLIMDFLENRISFDPDVDADLLAVELSPIEALRLIDQTANEIQVQIDAAYAEEASLQSCQTESLIPFGATCQMVAWSGRLHNLSTLRQNIAGLAMEMTLEA